MERGGKRPDPPALAHATVRAAVAEAAALRAEAAAVRRRQVVRRPHDLAGAGGRAAARRARARLSRLPAASRRQPSRERAKHLFDVQIPMLFLQGTRDALADLAELAAAVRRARRRATLKLFADADHSFHVPARTGRKDAEVRAEMLDALAAWIDGVIADPR